MDIGQTPRFSAGAWPSTSVEQLAGSSSLLDARVWFDQTPWRFAAGWTVLAATLAVTPFSRMFESDLLQIALLFVLADPLWGSIWGLMVTPQSLPAIRASVARSRIWLPYLHSGSPAAHLFGLEGPGMLALIMRVAVPAILLSLLVSGLLSAYAVWLTVFVVILSIAGWVHRHVELIPLGLLHSLMTVALPWLLVLVVLPNGALTLAQAALIGLWTLFAWGAALAISEPHRRDGLVLLGLAQVGIILELILLRAPLWLGPVVVCWLPTWLAVHRRVSLTRVRFWWLVALVLTAFAIAQNDAGPSLLGF